MFYWHIYCMIFLVGIVGGTWVKRGAHPYQVSEIPNDVGKKSFNCYTFHEGGNDLRRCFQLWRNFD